MLRSIYLFVLIALLALAGVWLADNPGSVELRWSSYVIETSVIVLVAALAITALLIAILINVYRWMRASPGRLGGAFASRKRGRGLDAISNGMVAIAAGDAEGARRAAIEAERHLKGAPMTLLLAAQAAELYQDDRAAKVYYDRMVESPETELMGLRGLIALAKSANDLQGAIALATRADAFKPGTEWVLKELLDLQLKTRNYAAAAAILPKMPRGKAAKNSALPHLRAVIDYQRALIKLDTDDASGALALVQSAHKSDPDFIPAASLLLKLSPADRKRDKLVSAIWARTPHPDVVSMVKNFVPLENESDWLTRAKSIFGAAGGDHRYSNFALARAALDAREWGDARKYLTNLASGEPTAIVYRMLAELEEKANADAAAARNWIIKSTEAPQDPLWICNGCGRQEVKWTAHCPSCDRFDSLHWRNADRGEVDGILEAEVVQEISVVS